ncbi:hypothetical protein CROQUDRAFT_663553 [Cronartium quercuum f. sp. fusiforme G11]|uniref:HTH APSES-type domain-containing protein n=1 Tax=Cronartium quercuum f. sp. fusiforme G11 TaxID=708437 RepID=A0A9P6N851_9BASI|nr:hypothetical protein CROQUDRAFT_663553 [Cronartium quercuum f. sp. fusiforme G11]
MSATRSTPQRSTRRSTRSPPHSAVPASKQFTSFATAANPLMPSSIPAVSSSPQKSNRSTEALDPLTTESFESLRPSLPLEKKNPLLASFRGRVRSVKTQNIPLENNWTITIARVKVPTSNGTAGHLIKRFDTNAISATSFFRAAFPDASEEEVNAQMDYISKIYDTATAGGDHIGPECKLTGTWVPLAHAEVIAEWYGLTKFAAELISYPDPNRPSGQAPLSQSTEPSQTLLPSEPTLESTPGPKAEEPISAPRSSKRARVAPPSFGNTSPSHFSLPPPAPASALALKEIPGLNGLPAADEPDPTEEPMTISNDEADEPDQKKVQVVVTETSSGHEGTQTVTTTTTTTSVMGTDEQVELAKQEALSLVASIQESAALGGATSSTTTVSSSESSQKKRGISDVEDVESEAPAALPSRGFFNRLWSRKQSSKSHGKKVEVAPKPREIAPLPSAILPQVTPVTKRNLAVVGIVVAGAAASIAPYFF